MRKDMAKVVTESPRHGHANLSRKWAWHLRQDEYGLDDHGPTRASSARRRQYGWDSKEFSDLLGPLRRYLRKQVGRPWDKVWSEITQTLDCRSITGQHIFDHIRWEVEQDVWIGDDGRLYHKRSWGTAIELVGGLYVHPVTRLLRYKAGRRLWPRQGPYLKARAALREFGLEVETVAEVRRYRVDGMRVWEHKDGCWFIHTYRCVPERLVRMITRSDGRDVPVYSPAHQERVATKQASRKEIRNSRLLLRDPLA